MCFRCVRYQLVKKPVIELGQKSVGKIGEGKVGKERIDEEKIGKEGTVRTRLFVGQNLIGCSFFDACIAMSSLSFC